MSLTYQVQLKSLVTEKDHSRFKIELRNILPEDEMKAILALVLKEEGWQEKDGSFHKAREDETVSIDLNTMEVVTEVKKEAQVKVSVTREDSESSDMRGSREASPMTPAEREKLHVQKKAKLRKLAVQVSKTLQETVEQRRQELDQTLARVYARAIKKKATQLGSVQEMHEEVRDDGVYSIMIRVKEGA